MRHGGAYYPLTALQDAYDRLITEGVVAASATGPGRTTCEGQFEAIRDATRWCRA